MVWILERPEHCEYWLWEDQEVQDRYWKVPWDRGTSYQRACLYVCYMRQLKTQGFRRQVPERFTVCTHMDEGVWVPAVGVEQWPWGAYMTRCQQLEEWEIRGHLRDRLTVSNVQ